MTIDRNPSGTAKAGLATGIIGTSLGALNLMGNGCNFLGGMFNNRNNCDNGFGCGFAHGFNCGFGNGYFGHPNGFGPGFGYINGYGNGCSDDRLVDRYTLAQEAKISALETQVALRDANTHSDEKNVEIVKYFEGRLREIEKQLCQQEVQNQKTVDSIQLVSERAKCCCDALEEKICCETKERKCADNSIVNYVNSTFYPKQVCAVSTTTPNTAQILYNPLPTSDDCCCR